MQSLTPLQAQALVQLRMIQLREHKAQLANLTPQEQEIRTDFAAFVRQVFRTVTPGTTYLHNWHIDLMAEYLEACRRREIKRLLINLPPRMLKSIVTSIAWPAWLLGHNASEKIIASSYAESLALKHSVDCRLVVQSEWYKKLFPLVQLAHDQNEKGKFQTTARGHRLATSVGSSPLGEGGDFLIFDDPLNPLQAATKSQRDKANEWYEQSFSTRLDDKINGVIVGVMQRLDADDLTGHLLARGGWEHLKIPAIAPTRVVIDFGRVHIVREIGDVMHAEREPLEILERQKIDMGSMAFAGQYQQEPAPLEGGIYKAVWFKRYEKRQEVYSQIVQSWDTASKAGELNDPSVCTTWGIRPDGADLLHVLVARLEYPELKARAIQHAELHAADAILIEDKSSGQALLQDLQRETKLPVIAITPTADKITRASATSSMVEAGRVSLPINAPWLGDYETEMLTFPNAVHDDQVDSTSQFLNWLRTKTNAQPMIRRL